MHSARFSQHKCSLETEIINKPSSSVQIKEPKKKKKCMCNQPARDAKEMSDF